jgi:hypothetical protein
VSGIKLGLMMDTHHGLSFHIFDVGDRFKIAQIISTSNNWTGAITKRVNLYPLFRSKKYLTNELKGWNFPWNITTNISNIWCREMYQMPYFWTNYTEFRERFDHPMYLKKYCMRKNYFPPLNRPFLYRSISDEAIRLGWAQIRTKTA